MNTTQQCLLTSFLHLICLCKRNNWIHNSNHKEEQKGVDYHKQAALLAAVMETSLSTLEVAASFTSGARNANP